VLGHGDAEGVLRALRAAAQAGVQARAEPHRSGEAVTLAALLLAGTVSGTFPVFQRAIGSCSAGTDSVRDVQTARIVGQVQSSTWLAMRPAMEALPEVWAAYWPVCRAEADTFPLATVQGRAGQPFTAPAPLPLRRPLFIWGVARNGRGVSCRGKVVTLP